MDAKPVSGDGTVQLAWGDGEHRFRLGIGELRELQEKCAAGPPQILVRLARNEWLVDDVIQTLRLGLIGGGMDATRALAKVSKYITPGNFMSHTIPALQVLQAALMGDAEDEIKKKEAAASPEKSDGPNSSAPPPPSGGQSTNSTAPAFGNSPQPLKDGTDATAVPRANGPAR